MAGAPLSEATRLRLEALFQGNDAKAAAEILVNECGSNLPFCERNGPDDCDRLRFAALKLSDGRLDRLREAVELAKIDWRDLLMGAGFGYHAKAHEKWFPPERGG